MSGVSVQAKGRAWMPVQAWMFWRSRSGQRREPTRVACSVRKLHSRCSCLQQPAGLCPPHPCVATSLAVCCGSVRHQQSLAVIHQSFLCAGKRPRMALADEDAGRGDAGDEGPSTSGRDSNGATASGGVLPHRQYRGQRVETPSYPGAFCCSHCLSPATAFRSSLRCTTFALHAAISKHSFACRSW